MRNYRLRFRIHFQDRMAAGAGYVKRAGSFRHLANIPQTERQRDSRAAASAGIEFQRENVEQLQHLPTQQQEAGHHHQHC